MESKSELKLCLVDMNNGLPNQAIRCFKRIIAAFTANVTRVNPGVAVTLAHVQIRNLGELPPPDSDLVLSSGGPGSPFDGYEDPWCAGYRAFVDRLVDRNMAQEGQGPAMLAICHSYEILAHHLKLGTVQPRASRKFGVMPVYMTEEGKRSPTLGEFGERLFAFEHRNFEVVELDEKRLKELKGELWARESRDGVSKGRGLLAFKMAPGLDGMQFHPEADRTGVVTWIRKPEMAEAFKDAYGEETYEQMMDTVDDPSRLARTFALVVPGWLHRRFDVMAARRGWTPVGPPSQDLEEFKREPAA
jgi:GMP synthase-like glutamine amidotransferase